MKVQRDGNYAIKSYAHDSMGMERVTALSEQLRASGLLVPETWQMEELSVTRQAWVEGPTLRERMRDWFVAGDPQALTEAASLLSGVVAAVEALHRADASQVCVPRHDPFSRIDPRLAAANSPIKPLAMQLRERLASWRMEGHLCTYLIHGDFHAGQVIFESATQRWWLIDLDDAAIGPREYDIANFAVHVMTSGPQAGLQPIEHLSVILDVCLKAYTEPLDHSALMICAATALLRRGLKLAERGVGIERVMAILAAGHSILPA